MPIVSGGDFGADDLPCYDERLRMFSPLAGGQNGLSTREEVGAAHLQVLPYRSTDVARGSVSILHPYNP